MCRADAQLSWIPRLRYDSKALSQLLAHGEYAALVAHAQVIAQTVAAAKDAGVLQMHVRTVSSLIGLHVLPSHFPDFVTFGFGKWLPALFTSHADGASPRRWQFNVRHLGFAVAQ
jgi:hypothetical protein